jgi:acetyl-CoA carboxylase carboxyl transferase subunit alpha
MTYLEFEKPLADIEGKAEELRAMARKGEGVDLEKEAAALDKKAGDMLRDLYGSSIPGARRRSPATPSGRIASDYIDQLFTEYTPWPATAPLARITP